NLSEVTLFSNSHSAQKTISVLGRGINSCYRNISLEATPTFQFFLRKKYIIHSYIHHSITFTDVRNKIKDRKLKHRVLKPEQRLILHEDCISNK
uniref:Uncharacterized protein n=1 Tax=Strigamia maritima TaxID=126957 RepID=T1IQ66_STRMM